jgi:proline iminopeptidase
MLSDGVQTISVGGVVHWVRVAGSANGGIPLVLLHGGPGGNAYPIEQSVGDGLAESLTVIFYDQRGCGRSDRPSDHDSYCISRLVADLEDLRSALEIDRIVPWGVSYGCQLAAEYTVAHPERVARLVLHAPPICGPLHPGPWALRPASIDAVLSPSARAKLRLTLSGMFDPIERMLASTEVLGSSDEAIRFLYHDTAMTPQRIARSTATPAMNLDLALAVIGTERAELADELAAVAVPTLVMIGLWDHHVGVDIARDLVDRLPDAVLQVFEHSAHLIDEEQPERYVAAITDFLRRERSHQQETRRS